MRTLLKGLTLLGLCFSDGAFASPAAQITNPANLVTAGKGTRWETGFVTGSVQTSFNRATTIGAGNAGDYKTSKSFPLLPFVAISHAYNDKIMIGLAIDIPSYVDLEWPDHTFDLNVGGTNLDGITKSTLMATRFGPTVALRINDNWSTGGRLFLQQVSAMEVSDFSKLKGDGHTYGAQLGLRYASKEYIAGVAYTTRTNTEVRGYQADIHPLATTAVPGAAKSDILLPDRLLTNFAMALRPDLWAELEVEWFGWSYVDERAIYQANDTVTSPGKTARHYHDTINTRLGLRWQMNPTTAVYGAIGYEPTPVPEEDATPSVNFLRRTRVTAGAVWKLAGDWRLDTAYQYARGHARTIHETIQDNTVSGIDTGLYEGTYDSKAHSIRISITNSF